MRAEVGELGDKGEKWGDTRGLKFFVTSPRAALRMPSLQLQLLVRLVSHVSK